MIYGILVSLVFWAIRTFTPYHFHNLLPEQPMFFIDPVRCLVGGALGFGLLWLIRWVGGIAFKREAMGVGDVFLMGAIGSILGPAAVLVTLMLSSVYGSVVGIGMILLSKAKLGKFVAIPFGPYICLGCLTWMFWGPELGSWYLRLLRL